MRTQTSLGTPGSFQKALLKLNIVEQLKLVDGDSVFATQCKLGAADPAMHDQVIQDITDQMCDPGSYQGTENLLGVDLLRLIYKYNRI